MNTRFKLLAVIAVCFMVMGLRFSDAAIDPKNIVGIWLFDDGKGDVAQDASPNGYNGQINGAKWDKGKFDQALSFSKGNTVTIPVGKAAVTDMMSLLMWIQFTDLGGQQNYFSIWDMGDNRYVPYKTDGHEFRSWTNTWNIGSGFTVKAKTWYHVANTYDGKKASIYVDGEQKVSQAVPKFQLLEQEQTAWIATDKGTGFLSACVVDEVGLFNAALSAADVKTVMTKGIHQAAYAVDPLGKLTTLWGRMKADR